MITLVSKTKIISKSLSSLRTKEKAGLNDSFLQTLQKLSKKSISNKNNTLLLKLNDSKLIKTDNKNIIKKEKMALLLKNDKKQIDSKILASLDISSLKLVINSAKNLLKQQIQNNSAFKNIKEMPNTIKGLLDLAKSLKIDISKITLKKIITENFAQTTTKLTTKITKIADKTSLSQKKSISELPIKLENLLQTKMAIVPLFSNIKKRMSAHLTQDLVKEKGTNKTILKKIKPTNDILTTLLKSDKVIKQNKQGLKLNINNILTDKIKTKKNDTSINISDITQQIAQQNNSLHVSTNNQTFIVKMHEAKQMVKYLAHNIKQAIDEYKPPFTKIKIKLNPQKLGEVNLMIIQRGKNVHVNISSNTTAITVLAQNSGDLKVQLTQNGMNNASLNFSNSGNMPDGSNAQQHQNAKKFYQQFDDDEKGENTLNSLEILIPRYI